MRKFVVGTVAILLFGVVAVLIVYLAPTASLWPDGPGDSRATDAAFPRGPLPPLPPAGGTPGGESRALMALPLVEYGPPPARPPPDSWEAVKPVARLSALGPVGAAVGRELAELQPQLSACFDEVSQARHGQRPYTSTRDEARLEEAGATVLVLQLEMSHGEVRIVDAPVETHGSASDGLIACAQKVLRGHVIKEPAATTGGRARVMFSLME